MSCKKAPFYELFKDGYREVPNLAPCPANNDFIEWFSINSYIRIFFYNGFILVAITISCLLISLDGQTYFEKCVFFHLL